MRLLHWIAVGIGIGLLSPAFAHEGAHDEEHEEGNAPEASSGVGPGKAVVSASAAEGLELSKEAVKTLELRTQQISSRDMHRIPARSLVYFREEIGVYRLRGLKYKLLEVKVMSKSAAEAVIRAPDLVPGDQIVTGGAALLRLAELEAFGGSGDGHGH